MGNYKHLSEIETAALYRLADATEPLTGSDLYLLIVERTTNQYRESGLYQTLRRLSQRAYVLECRKQKRNRAATGELVAAYTITQLGREVLQRTRRVHLEQSDDLTKRRRRATKQ